MLYMVSIDSIQGNLKIKAPKLSLLVSRFHFGSSSQLNLSILRIEQ